MKNNRNNNSQSEAEKEDQWTMVATIHISPYHYVTQEWQQRFAYHEVV